MHIASAVSGGIRGYTAYTQLLAGYTLKKNVYAPCAFKDFIKADSFGAIFCAQKMKTHTQEVFLATNCNVASTTEAFIGK